MKRIIIFLCLMALATNCLADTVISKEIIGNTLICSETETFFSNSEEIGGTWEIYGQYNGEKLSYTSITPLEAGTYTNTVSIDISNLPCGAVVQCYSNYIYSPSGQVGVYYENYSVCPDTEIIKGGSIFGNGTITIGNNTNLSGNNFGKIPFGNGNITTNITATKILGLSKDFFFKLAGVLLITVILLNVRPVHLGLASAYLVLIVLTSVLELFAITGTLLLFILIIVLIELYKRGRL